ncbi:MAG: amino acid ABC transporter substrate-binding protein, partial [Sphingobacteriaceae bacterium]
MRRNTIILLLLAGSFLLTQCSKKSNTDKTKLKIGVILSLTGNGAVTGDYTLKGIQLAVNEQNAKGGLLGKQIELDIQDSKGVAATGLGIIETMFSSTTKPFMVCSNTSDVSLAVKTETEKNKVILVGSAATDKLTEGGNYIIRNYIESGQISDNILEYLHDELHITSLGIFYANNEFGNSVNNKMAEKTGGYSITLPFDIGYDDKSLDYNSLIASQNTGAVPAIYVIGLGNSLGVFIKQLRAAGYAGTIIADPLFNNPGTIAAAGTAATGVKFLDFDFHKDS